MMVRSANLLRRAYLTIRLLLMVLPVGCGASWALAKDPAQASSLARMASGVGFSTFDPVRATPPTVDYLRPVYDTLVVRRGLDRFEPGLATTWEFQDGNRQLVFTLREGVRFSDGSRFDAMVVKGNLDRGRAVEGSPWADVYRAIDSVVVLAPNKVALRLSSANPALIENFANNPGMMVGPAALKDEASLARHPIGTGPWKLDPARTRHGDQYTFVRHDAYWGSAEQLVETLVIRQMTEATARVNALRSAQVDVATVPQDQAAVLERLGFGIMATNKVYYMLAVWDAEGASVSALADRRVRRALSLAIDRRAILKAIFGGRGTSGLNFYPVGASGHSADLDTEVEYDPALARRLLQEAGQGAGLELHAVVQANNARFAAAVAGELAKVGIRIQLKVMPDVGAFQAAVRQRQSPLGIFAHQTALPLTLYSSLRSPDGRYNPFKLRDPELAALARTAAEIDIREAAPQYGQLFKRLVSQDALVFPIVHVELVSAMRKGVTGGEITYSSAGLPDPRYLRFSPN